MLSYVFIGLLLQGVTAFPSNELDKVRENDVAANEISAIKLDQGVSLAGIDSNANEGKVTTVPPPPTTYGGEGGFKQPASMFARLIDDIFQIPIAVLQSVAKLITNPFRHPVPADPPANS